MKTAIASGIDGFIGKSLIKVLTKEKVNVIAADIGNEPKRIDVPFAGANLPLGVFGNSLLAKDIGFDPTFSFEKGVRRASAWLSEVAKNDSQI